MVDEPDPPERESSPPPRLRDDPSVPAGVRKMARDWHATRPEPVEIDLSRVRASLLALEAASAPSDEDEDEALAPPPRLRDDPSVPAGVRKMTRDWHATRPEPAPVDLSATRALIAALEASEGPGPSAVREDEAEEDHPPPRLRDDPSVPAGVRKLARDWQTQGKAAEGEVDLSRVRASLLALEGAEARAPEGEEEENVSAPPPRLRDDPSVPAGVRKMARDWHDTRPEPVEIDLSRVRASLLALEGAEARAPEAAQEPTPAEASNVVALGEGTTIRTKTEREAQEPGPVPQTGAKVVSLVARLGQSKGTVAAVALAAGAVLVPTLPRVLPVVADWWDESFYSTSSSGRDPTCYDLPKVLRERPALATEETRQLDEAHAELARAFTEPEWSALLARLEADRARYGESAYSEEREVLRLQALLCQARGSWRGKRQLVRDGEAFLKSHPRSPYAETVQIMLQRVR